MADWAGERVGLSFIPPGEPWGNGYVCEYRTLPCAEGSDPEYV